MVRPAVFAPGGAVSLELLVLWFYLIEVVVLFRRPLRLIANVAHCIAASRLRRSCMHAPLGELDTWLVGKRWEFLQRAVREPYDDDSPFWSERSTLCELRPGAASVASPPPITIVTGLHDFFAEQCAQRRRPAGDLEGRCGRGSTRPWPPSTLTPPCARVPGSFGRLYSRGGAAAQHALDRRSVLALGLRLNGWGEAHLACDDRVPHQAHAATAATAQGRRRNSSKRKA